MNAVPPRIRVDKGMRAAASARPLLNAGDVDGACNRAYYAMYEAAHAALAAVAPADWLPPRTHSGLIAAFGLQRVKPGLLAPELGKAINRAVELRLVADYQAGSVGRDDAARVVDDADRLVAAIERFVDARSTDPPDRG
jgi:uncharacterized protein (UPF0332 family)